MRSRPACRVPFSRPEIPPALDVSGGYKIGGLDRAHDLDRFARGDLETVADAPVHLDVAREIDVARGVIDVVIDDQRGADVNGIMLDHGLARDFAMTARSHGVRWFGSRT